jgi:lysophospholipase L1-like esterase
MSLATVLCGCSGEVSTVGGPSVPPSAASLAPAAAATAPPTPVTTPAPITTPLAKPTPNPSSSPAPALWLACVGDSITAGYIDAAAINDLAHALSYYHVDAAHSYCGVAASQLAAAGYVDLAIPGEITPQITDQVPQIPLATDVVVAYAGTNDCFRQADPMKIDGLVTAIRTRVPKAKLVLLTVRKMSGYPNAIMWAVQTWNPRLRAIAAAAGATLVDLENDPRWYTADWPDNVHPDVAASAKLGAVVAAAARR